MIAALEARVAQQERAFVEAARYVERVAEHYPDVCGVVFGSYARGDFHDGSDIDLLLVSDAFAASPVERERVLYDLSPGGIDIFAYRAADIARMVATNHPTVYYARSEGIVLRGTPPW